MIKQRIRFSLVFFILFFSIIMTGSVCAAMENQTRENLDRLARDFSRSFYVEKNYAESRALELGMPLRTVTPDGRVSELMRFENHIPVYYITHNLEGAGFIKTDQLWPAGDSGLNLTGDGQVLGIWDGGKVRLTHQEFQGRATQKDRAQVADNHPTHVATTMAGAGIEADARGMSYEAIIHAYDWNNDKAEMAAAAGDGLLVSNHSYGTIAGWAYGDWYGGEIWKWHWFGDVAIDSEEDYRFGYYNYESMFWDFIAQIAPYYLIVKSAGNDRDEEYSGEHYVIDPETEEWVLSTVRRDPDGGMDGFDSIPTVGTAKNILTVGAIDSSRGMSSFSGWGPTDDGRIKPDIVAKGVGVFSATAESDSSYATWNGTSMSSPMVSGSLGILNQHQENLYGQGNLFRSSTMKALIIHGADDLIGGEPGPDYSFGWGLMNTERSAEIMSMDDAAGKSAHIYELTLEQGESLKAEFKATGDEPLRITIVWTDHPGPTPKPSLNPPDLMLVNDLDMRLINQDGVVVGMPYVLYPENPELPAGTGDNFRDNVEMIHIQDPYASAVYTLEITHKKELYGEFQDFSLIITGNGPEKRTPLPGVLMLLLDDQ